MSRSGVPTPLTHPRSSRPPLGLWEGRQGLFPICLFISQFALCPRHLEGEAAMGLFTHMGMGWRQVGPVPLRVGSGTQATSPFVFVCLPFVTHPPLLSGFSP
jgi:hypothetical protein